MALKTPDRYQVTAMPPVVEDYVSLDDPVRAYDAMIDAIGSEALGLPKEWKKVGNSPYEPMTMLKLLVYGYSYGWRSSRKLERANKHNISFMWLMGGLKPDFKTIANFRRNNLEVLKQTLKQTAKICYDLDLIDGNHLFVDGSKIRGNCSINQSKTKKRWEEKLGEVNERIEEIIKESERLDQEESDSIVKLDEELKDGRKLKAKIESILEKGKTIDRKKINGTDTDAADFKSRQGSHAGFNAQTVTDGKNGLIANVDVVSENNDLNQFSNQINQAQETLEKSCETAVGDSGYHYVDDLKEIGDQGVKVIVPSQKQAAKNPKDEPFAKEEFHYNIEADEYVCPEGKHLYRCHYLKKKNYYQYRMKRSADCRECDHFGKCTKSKRGRSISRLQNEEYKEELQAYYESEEGQAIYKKRKEKAELPFGHIKRNLNGGAFLIRGLEAVKAEYSIFASCFNIARMITLIGGVQKLIEVLKSG